MPDQNEKETDRDAEELKALDSKMRAFEHKPHVDSAVEMEPMTPSAMRAARVGFEIMLAVLLGLGIGWFCDKKLHTMPLCSLVFAMIGFAAGILNAWRAMQGIYSEVGFRRDKPAKDR